MKKKVLITGSSKGIGKSIATTLASAGYDVFLTGRNETRLKNLAQEIGAADYFAIDLTKKNACDELISKVGKIDILINNAGDYVWSPIDGVLEEDIERIFKLNLEVPYKLCALVSKEMKERKYGRIINVGSISGAVGEGNASLYSASKSGLIGMSKALALELAEYGITVNVVNPGWVETELCTETFECGELDKKEELDCIPQKRFIHPNEVAKMVEYLCSENAKGVTGQSLNICAGLSLG